MFRSRTRFEICKMNRLDQSETNRIFDIAFSFSLAARRHHTSLRRYFLHKTRWHELSQFGKTRLTRSRIYFVHAPYTIIGTTLPSTCLSWLTCASTKAMMLEVDIASCMQALYEHPLDIASSQPHALRQSWLPVQAIGSHIRKRSWSCVQQDERGSKCIAESKNRLARSNSIGRVLRPMRHEVSSSPGALP